MGQSDNQLWHDLRNGRLTGSKAFVLEQAVSQVNKHGNAPDKYDKTAEDYMVDRFKVIAHRMTEEVGNTITKTGGIAISQLPAVKWGKDNEDLARNVYATQMRNEYHTLTVEETGLVMADHSSGLAASPDGIVHPNPGQEDDRPYLLEIKCPSSRAKTGLETSIMMDTKKKDKEGRMIQKVKPFYLDRVPGSFIGGIPEFKLNNHRQAKDYASQMKFTMMVTGLYKAHLFVWTPKGSGIVEVMRDVAWEEYHAQFFRRFFASYLMPEALKKGIFVAMKDDKIFDHPVNVADNYTCPMCLFDETPIDIPTM